MRGTFKELLEGGMEAGSGGRQWPGYHGNSMDWAHHFGSIRATTGSYGWRFACVVPWGRASSYVGGGGGGKLGAWSTEVRVFPGTNLGVLPNERRKKRETR